MPIAGIELKLDASHLITLSLTLLIETRSPTAIVASEVENLINRATGIRVRVGIKILFGLSMAT
tara:strand:+ start:181 stop:372 length:192 start_codon:yes stop_codon:yes gene_type:complete